MIFSSRRTLAQVRQAPPLPRYTTTWPSSRYGATIRAYSSQAVYGMGLRMTCAPRTASRMSLVTRDTRPRTPVGFESMSMTSISPLSFTPFTLAGSRENRATS